jgi:transposase InsO family protein
MPWQSTNIMNQRTEFALRALRTENFTELCREFKISPKTGYKWKGRFLSEGLGGLEEESRRPKHSPEALSEEVVCRLVQFKQAHRFWGARKLQALYKRRWGAAPSESSIKRVLERCGMVEKRRQRPARQTGRLSQGRKATAANEVWTVDFKGWWHDGAGKSNPLTVRDEYSRYILELRHLAEAHTETVQACFERLFERYGLPQAIRSDNGPPFASVHALLGLSRLSAWWLALGIELERSRPGCPQDNGGHERMHRDVKREIQALAASTSIDSSATRQEAFEVWRQQFNQQRPHEALGMKCPAELYAKSSRRYEGTPQAITYPAMEVRRVQKAGGLRYGGSTYQISTALAGWDVGLRQVQGQMEVHFGRLLVGWLDTTSESFKAATTEPSTDAEQTPQKEEGGTVALTGAGQPLRSAPPRSAAGLPQSTRNTSAA